MDADDVELELQPLDAPLQHGSPIQASQGFPLDEGSDPRESDDAASAADADGGSEDDRGANGGSEDDRGADGGSKDDRGADGGSEDDTATALSASRPEPDRRRARSKAQRYRRDGVHASGLIIKNCACRNRKECREIMWRWAEIGEVGMFPYVGIPKPPKRPDSSLGRHVIQFREAVFRHLYGDGWGDALAGATQRTSVAMHHFAPEIRRYLHESTDERERQFKWRAPLQVGRDCGLHYRDLCETADANGDFGESFLCVPTLQLSDSYREIAEAEREFLARNQLDSVPAMNRKRSKKDLEIEANTREASSNPRATAIRLWDQATEIEALKLALSQQKEKLDAASRQKEKLEGERDALRNKIKGDALRNKKKLKRPRPPSVATQTVQLLSDAATQTDGGGRGAAPPPPWLGPLPLVGARAPPRLVPRAPPGRGAGGAPGPAPLAYAIPPLLTEASRRLIDTCDAWGKSGRSAARSNRVTESRFFVGMAHVIANREGASLGMRLLGRILERIGTALRELELTGVSAFLCGGGRKRRRGDPAPGGRGTREVKRRREETPEMKRPKEGGADRPLEEGKANVAEYPLRIPGRCSVIGCTNNGRSRGTF